MIEHGLAWVVVPVAPGPLLNQSNSAAVVGLVSGAAHTAALLTLRGPPAERVRRPLRVAPIAQRPARRTPAPALVRRTGSSSTFRGSRVLRSSSHDILDRRVRRERSQYQRGRKLREFKLCASYRPTLRHRRDELTACVRSIQPCAPDPSVNTAPNRVARAARDDDVLALAGSAMRSWNEVVDRRRVSAITTMASRRAPFCDRPRAPVAVFCGVAKASKRVCAENRVHRTCSSVVALVVMRPRRASDRSRRPSTP